MNEHKELIGKAFFGDAESKKKLMLLADEMFARGSFEDAASMYKEAAKCYEKGQIQANGSYQEAITRNVALQDEIGVFEGWVATHPLGFVSLPALMDGVTFEIVRSTLFCDSIPRKIQSTLVFLGDALEKLNIPIGSQGYSVERQACGILEDYFSPNAKRNRKLESVRVRIAIDLLAGHLLKELESGSQRIVQGKLE